MVLRQVSLSPDMFTILFMYLPRFDKEGYSIWRVDFKYNEELTQVFMSSNQIGGFFSEYELHISNGVS